MLISQGLELPTWENYARLQGRGLTSHVLAQSTCLGRDVEAARRVECDLKIKACHKENNCRTTCVHQPTTLPTPATQPSLSHLHAGTCSVLLLAMGSVQATPSHEIMPS